MSADRVVVDKFGQDLLDQAVQIDRLIDELDANLAVSPSVVSRLFFVSNRLRRLAALHFSMVEM